ncbi:MAG: hypothetical protein PHP92_03900 [Candidatus Nanoarchaeia archaeon]|nr:hypothetical protein [Candidatus Nanoarchaeia archaeon]
MSIFKNILGLLVVQEEKTEEIKQSPESEIQPVVVSKPIIQNQIKSSSKILKVLEETLKENNIDGFDYFEFRNALKTMASSIPDETTRFNAALATASSMNVDVEKLIETAKQYISILNEEGKKFEEDLESETTTMNNLIKENIIIEKSIKDKSNTIKTLTDEIAELQIKKKNNEDEITKNKSSLDVAKQQFITARDQLITDIKNDISKLNTYIKGGKKNGSSRKN